MKQFLKVFIVSLIVIPLVTHFSYAQNRSYAEESLEKGRIEAWLNKGKEYENIGDYKKAIEVYSKMV